MFDKFDNIGKIMIINNIIFNDKYKNRLVIDHSALTGRPCIVLDEVDEFMYLLPMTSSRYQGNFKSHQILLHKWDVVDDTMPKNKFVKLTPIIKRRLFSDVYLGELTPLAYYYLLKEIILLYNSEENKKYLDLELYKEVEESLNEKVLKLENKIQKQEY